MRIAYYTDSTTIGGAETVLGTLLAEVDRGIEAVVVGVDPGVVQWLAAQRPRSETRLLSAVRDRHDVARLVSNARGIRALRAHIFQANLPVPASCQYALAAATFVPRLITIAVEHTPYPLDGTLQLLLKRYTSRRLTAHVAVGERVAREVERLAALPTHSIRMIHNGVADVELEPLARAFEGPVLGAIGRLDRQKGFDVLLRSLAQVPQAQLVVVGDGQERDALERLAAELDLSERVRFEGWREDARRYLTTFDVLVVPSRFEGFPLVIVEAMLAGLPVVASAVGSVPESVLDGTTGLLVPPEDAVALASALRTLLGHPALRAQMGASGRKHALGFTSEAMARAYGDLYEKVLA